MKSQTYNRGFTLIEMLTAVSIFAVIMVISMGSILGIFEANRKARALRAVVSNLNLAIESMSKEMRFGKSYHCGNGSIYNPQNCASGGSSLAFQASDGTWVQYSFNNNSIYQSVDNGNSIPLTAPEVVVDDLSFYTLGTAVGDAYHPKIIMKVKVHAGTGKSRSDFVVQTMVSQRDTDY